MKTMIEKVCNLWLEPADYRCIPTTGATTPDGEAIMESGIALEAARKFHNIEVDLGRLLASRGNHVHLIRPGVVSFPVKQYAWAGLSLPTIKRSAQELRALVGDAKTLLPRPVRGDADPPWEKIAEALSSLPDNIIVIQHT
jgi:hypothetical protein